MKKESPKGLSFRNIIQYAGLTSEEYAVIKKDFYGSNWMILNVTLILSFFVLLAYAAVSIQQGAETDICISYSIACICCLIAGIVNIRNGKKNVHLLACLTDIFIALLWMMGIYNGTIGDPDRITMTFIVLIMVLPLVFNVRPGPIIAKLFCACIVFIIFVLKFKNPQVAGTDISDAVAFTASSMVLTTYLNCAKAKGILAQNQFKSAAIQDKLQLEEIVALNGQLEENQAQMEESASEQEAQIAEISALNSQLQDNQAEQEAQIEEIDALNSELIEQRDNLEKNYDAIRSLSKVYYASYYVDMDHDDYYELLSNDEIRSKYADFGPNGKAQASISWACENRIAPEYREVARAFTDYSTLSERMRDTEVISIRVQLVNGDWSRLRYIAGARHEDGTLKSCTFGARIVNDEVAEEEKQNAELQNALTLAQDSAAEQEAQLEEIAALNTQLQENQARLEEASAEQEAQLEETQALNQELQESKDRISEAYGMVEGLSSEYHTIWLVNKETLRMRLVRSNGISTANGAVQMAEKVVELDPTVKIYVENYVMPEDQERALREMSSYEVLRHLNENKYGIYAVNYLRKDDSGRISYHQIAFANADTEDGKKQFVLGFRDIDKIVKEEQKKKEELKKALLLAQDANNAMANAGYGMWHIILKDGVEPRMQVNDKMAELLGVAGQKLSEEELYNAWYGQIVPDAIPSVQASVGEMMAGHFSENTYQWVHPTKGVIYVRCGGTCQRMDDGTNVLSGYHADVTDIVYEEKKHNEELEKTKEAAEAANKAKTSFLFNMSHDIRTPMNAIIGYTNLMKRNPDHMEKWPDYLDKVISSSDFLLGLINNVLEMARIESGKMVLDGNVYAEDAFIDQIYSVFADEMGKKDLKFTKTVAVEHPYFYGDNVKLKEIVLNIVSNAQKYTMPGGSVDMSVKELPSDLDGFALIETTITDTGIGMSEEFLPHIFEEFAREQNSSGNKIQGTGLGMPIVKRLVELMGGTIEVSSKVGEGSTFTVTIPHRIADKPVNEAKIEDIDYSAFAGKRILLAEDNDLNAEIAMEILSEYDFKVERAEDGIVCVDMLTKAEAGYYDMILMDIQMPNLDGYGATRTIRDMNDPEKADIPIIAMTANAFDEDKRNAIDAGMDGHVAKPIEIPVLMRTLSDVFKDRSSIKKFLVEPKHLEDAVTHVKRIYFEMQRSKAVSVLPGGFFAYMAEQPEKLIFANDLCCSIWGCKNFEEFNTLVGGSFKGIVHPDDYERAEKEIWHQIDNGDTGLDQVKYKIIKKDGSIANIADYGRLVRDKEIGDIFYVFVAEIPGENL